MTVPLLGASTIQSAGAVIGALALVGFVTYVAFNIISGRREVGSEIELAPNRKPYLSDEQLETTKLNWTLGAGLALLLIIAVGLPLYWLAEPGRQDGAEEMFDETFIKRGEELFDEGSDCAACHGPGGTGGQASFTLLADDGETYIATVNWKAPALDTAALRFTKDELSDIIEFGRPGTPMVGWGERGQGPLTQQQIDNLVDYVFSLQDGLAVEGDVAADGDDPGLAPYEVVQAEVAEQLAADLGVAADAIDYTDPATGEALFNMDSIASGTYACARCHTQGWSIQRDAATGDPIPDDAREPIGGVWPDYLFSAPGSGSFGPPLRDVVDGQFATVDELAEFIDGGTTEGVGFGRTGMGSGRMPAFGSDPNTEDEHDGMFTPEMVCSVALYVAGLPDEGTADEPEAEAADAVDDEASEASIAADDDVDPQEMFQAGGYCYGVLHDEPPLDEADEDEEVSDQ